MPRIRRYSLGSQDAVMSEGNALGVVFLGGKVNRLHRGFDGAGRKLTHLGGEN
jgi:hypothetical protein